MFKVSKNLSYDYRARIGNGSNGTIVFDGIFDEKKVAVKKLLVRNIAKFDREKDILQLINLGKKHGNIVNCFGTETTEEFFYLALEICDFNCYKYFHDKQNGSPSPLSIQIRKEFEVMDIMTQTTEGVIFLHALNIIHRDIKPHNILIKKLDNGWQVKISDFGISKILKNDRTHTNLTHRVGSQDYMAPEVLNDQVTSKSSDVYSLGCFFYYMAANGEFPVNHVTPIQDGKFRVNIEKLIYNMLKAPKFDHFIKDLIQEMINFDRKLRTSADMVLKHGFFWDSSKKQEFLKDLKKFLDSRENLNNVEFVRNSLNFDTFDIIKNTQGLSGMQFDDVSLLINESSNGLVQRLPNSGENFSPCSLIEVRFLLLHIYTVSIAMFEYFTDAFREKYLNFESTYRNANFKNEIVLDHPSKDILNLKILLNAKSLKVVLADRDLSKKYVQNLLSAFACESLELKNIVCSDTTFPGNIKPYPHLRKLRIENSCWIELFIESTSLEFIEVKTAREMDMSNLINVLCRQSKLVSLFVPVDLVVTDEQCLILPFKLKELTLAQPINSMNHDNFPSRIMSFISNQMELNNLTINIPKNFKLEHFMQLFGTQLNCLESLLLFCHDNDTFLKELNENSVKIKRLIKLSIQFKKTNYVHEDIEKFVVIFPKLKQFEYKNDNFMYHKDGQKITCEINIPTPMEQIKNITIQHIDVLKVLIKPGTEKEVLKVLETFIQNNSSIKVLYIDDKTSNSQNLITNILHIYCSLGGIILKNLKTLKEIHWNLYLETVLRDNKVVEDFEKNKIKVVFF